MNWKTFSVIQLENPQEDDRTKMLRFIFYGRQNGKVGQYRHFVINTIGQSEVCVLPLGVANRT